MANYEAPNTLLSDSVFRVLDMACEGPISGFAPKPGAYGYDPHCSTYYDDVVVRNTDGSYNFNVTGDGYTFDYTLGTSGQSGIPGFQKVESILPLSSNTRIANPPEGAGPFKPVIASFTSNTYPDADAIKVTVRVPSLFAGDAEANTNPFQIDYAVDISINNGAFVPVGLHTIAGKCTSAYQRTEIYQLPKSTPASAYYEWKVRVRRVSPNILSMRVQNEIFVDSISIISTSLYAYPNSVLVGTKIGAGQFSSIPSRAFELAGLLVNVPSGYTPTQYGYSETPFTRQGDMDAGNYLIGFTTQSEDQANGVLAGMRVAGAGIPVGAIVTSVSPGPVYFFSVDLAPTTTSTNTTLTFTPTETTPTITAAVYPNVWLGNYHPTKQWTDNPAWIFNDLLTDPVHGLGDYIQSSAVDKWTLYEIAQYCDTMVSDGKGGLEPRFTCNAVIDQPQEAYSVLLNLASTFRGMLYYANGTIHASQQQNKPPVYAFNNSNVVEGVFNYSDTARDTRSTVAKVKWVDPQNGYRENVEYIEDNDGILRYGYQEKEMTAFACTSKGQAYRLGSWTLETERLLTETVTFQTSLEGLSLRPGDNFAIYDNFRNNRAQAGRITSFTTGRSLVNLDRSVALEPGYTYSLTAVVPKFQLDGANDLTGSDQIGYIRQSQVESFEVANSATSGTSSLIILGSFSSGLYPGSPFVLAASGTVASVFNRASFYTCLATAEIEPGKIEILGLQANSGIQFSIQTGYTTVDWPVNPGDRNTVILPPSNLFVTGLTGITQPDNRFFSSINLTWDNSPSPDLGYYVVSGREWDTDYERATVIGTEFNFTRGDTGQYLFKVAAVSHGGRESSFVTGGFLVGTLNPLGTLRTLSGVRLVEDFDKLYTHPVTGYTGYVGLTPTFNWEVLHDDAGNPIVDAQFISGYRLNWKSFDGGTTYAGPIDIEGVDNTRYEMTGGQIYGFAGGPQRGFDFRVQTVDIYGNVANGGNIKVNNPPMKPPFASGFVGFNGGVIYNVTPSLQYDTSGIYLWTSQSPAFSPTYSNYAFNSSNLAGNAEIGYRTGALYTWFALGDTFGAAGNPIFGPVTGSSDAIFNAFDIDITDEINAAFAALTGEFTSYITTISGEGVTTRLAVDGISGQILGAPGSINTALTVRVDSAILTTGSALASQINAVNANVTTVSNRVTATGATLLTAMATADGALAQWITNLGVQTSGLSSSVQVGATAFVTGSVAGLGGVAVASWGFKLDANGKVVSMQATAASGAGVVGNYGKIVFGGADLESNTYTAGSAGWQIQAGGNAEFNNLSARGAFTGGATPSAVAMDTDGLRVGNFSADRVQIGAGSNKGLVYCYNPDGVVATRLGYANLGGGNYVGYLEMNSDAGSSYTTIRGGGSSDFGGGVNIVGALDVDSTSNFDGVSTHNAQLNITSTHKIHFSNAGTNVSYIKEDYGVNLYGSADHPIHIRGGSLVRAGTAGGSFGTQNILNFNIDFNPDTSWSDGILPNTFECATAGGGVVAFTSYLKFRGPGGGTVWVPYVNSAP